MRENVKSKSTEQALKQIRKLFASPVLSSESERDYISVLTALIEDLEPANFIERTLIKDWADQHWEMVRYMHHKTMVIEREHERHKENEIERRQRELGKLKQSLALCQDRVASEAEKAAKAPAPEGDKNAEAGTPNEVEKVAEAEKTAQPEKATAATTEPAADQPEQVDEASASTTELDRMNELEIMIDDTAAEIDEILYANADEVDHAKALQSGIEYYEQLDRLFDKAKARRDDALEQLEFYRQGLGRALGRISDEVIEAEFTGTTGAPPLAGPSGDQQ